jgi:hypothetical protein
VSNQSVAEAKHLYCAAFPGLKAEVIEYQNKPSIEKSVKQYSFVENLRKSFFIF